MADRFTADKLAWIEQITRDAALGHFAARVGVIIGSHLNRETGEAFPGQERLAGLCGATERGVRKAVGELADRQHLMVEVSAGRGRVCRYRPILHTEKRNGGSSFDDAKSGTVVPVIGTEKRNEKVDKSGTVVPTNPLKEPIEVIRAANDAEEAAPLRGPLPDGFPSEQMIGLSHERFLRERLSIDPRLCAEKFRAFYAGGSCANWRSRWETWVLREIEHTRKNSPPAPERPETTVEQRQLIRARRVRTYADTGVWEPDWGVTPDLRDSAVAECGEAAVVSYLDSCAWRANERTLVAPLGITRDRLNEHLAGWLKRNGLKVTVAKAAGPITDAFIESRFAALARLSPAVAVPDQSSLKERA